MCRFFLRKIKSFTSKNHNPFWPIYILLHGTIWQACCTWLMLTRFLNGLLSAEELMSFICLMMLRVYVLNSLSKKTIKKAVNLIHCFKSGSGKPLIQTRKLTVSWAFLFSCGLKCLKFTRFRLIQEKRIRFNMFLLFYFVFMPYILLF